MTNKELAKSDKVFIKCCELVGIRPSKGQAGKYKRGLGQAFGRREKAKELLKGDVQNG